MAAKSALGRDMLACGMAENACPLLCDVLAVQMLSSPLEEAAMADTLELVAQALVGMAPSPCRNSCSPPCREGPARRSHGADERRTCDEEVPGGDGRAVHEAGKAAPLPRPPPPPDAAGQANLDRAVEMYNQSATLSSPPPAPQDRAPTSKDDPHAQSSFADGTESSEVSCPDSRRHEVNKEGTEGEEAERGGREDRERSEEGGEGGGREEGGMGRQREDEG
eukprot:712407-Hanusia_phi.AAC.3